MTCFAFALYICNRIRGTEISFAYILNTFKRTMHNHLTLLLHLAVALRLVHGFSVTSKSTTIISRRVSLTQTVALIGGVATATTTLPIVSNAEPAEDTPRVVDRMGGLLERYQDVSKGFTLLSPSGWNKFEGEAGAYDVKWQDIVDARENVKISSTPVKSTTTSISALGTNIQSIGENLAAKRNAKLVHAQERSTDGILFYTFEFALNDGTHQLLSLCVYRGKIWSLDANASEKRWSKKEAMYNNIIGSFLPKLG